MTDAIIAALAIAGSLFVLLAAVGVTRMPDLYMRMSTVTKASTLGLALLLVAAVIELDTWNALAKAVAIIVFGFITSPVAAHMISRAAYFQAVELWSGTVLDELRGQYTRQHELEHPPPAETLAGTILGPDEEGTDAIAPEQREP
jgi:multicomponent Na+:H+ antiporter subunit G